MAIEPTDPLERARDLVRDHEPPPAAWEELSQSVMTKVREAVRPSYPIRAFTEATRTPAEGSGEDRTYVSSRVVLTALRRLLQGSPTHAPTDIKVDVDDERLLEVRIGLACAYGVDLPALAARVRGEVVALLEELLGPEAAGGPGVVTIEVVDVVPGDPNLV
ncbi:hypothetical protein [Nocardioides nanhaiensis]|uniref:Asp23/Gls24 family envelope stress response protein n=1 Tax=Nocardioides nanhaiensis TaxID=1476871 RepID=A0ABP8VUK4_9ACTN